jgi:hypothetical protein
MNYLLLLFVFSWANAHQNNPSLPTNPLSRSQLLASQEKSGTSTKRSFDKNKDSERDIIEVKDNPSFFNDVPVELCQTDLCDPSFVSISLNTQESRAGTPSSIHFVDDVSTVVNMHPKKNNKLCGCWNLCCRAIKK